MQFSLHPSSFPTDEANVAYVVSLLSGPARQWGAVEWSRQSSVCSTYKRFSEEPIRTFDPAKPEKEAAMQLAYLTQGNRSVNLQTQPIDQPVQVKALNDHVIHSCSLQTNQSISQ